LKLRFASETSLGEVPLTAFPAVIGVQNDASALAPQSRTLLRIPKSGIGPLGVAISVNTVTDVGIVDCFSWSEVPSVATFAVIGLEVELMVLCNGLCGEGCFAFGPIFGYRSPRTLAETRFTLDCHVGSF
jgi:hypothetical protein